MLTHRPAKLVDGSTNMSPNRWTQRTDPDGLLYIAYVPMGSIARGRTLARAPTTGCVACHGGGLQGVGLIPSLAGRSPTYILRQLLAFKTGARASAAGEPMKAVVAHLQLNNMIDVAAYAGSLQP